MHSVHVTSYHSHCGSLVLSGPPLDFTLHFQMQLSDNFVIFRRHESWKTHDFRLEAFFSLNFFKYYVLICFRSVISELCEYSGTPRYKKKTYKSIHDTLLLFCLDKFKRYWVTDAREVIWGWASMCVCVYMCVLSETKQRFYLIWSFKQKIIMWSMCCCHILWRKRSQIRISVCHGPRNRRRKLKCYSLSVSSTIWNWNIITANKVVFLFIFNQFVDNFRLTTQKNTEFQTTSLSHHWNKKKRCLDRTQSPFLIMSHYHAPEYTV